MQLNTYKNAPHPPALPVIRSVPLSNVPTMISSTTPYKLADIIRDTWPNLYRPMKKEYNTERTQEQNDRKD
jgi:hypothetical protein